VSIKVVMKKIVFLVICTVVGATLSGCISYEPLSSEEYDRRSREAEKWESLDDLDFPDVCD